MDWISGRHYFLCLKPVGLVRPSAVFRIGMGLPQRKAKALLLPIEAVSCPSVEGWVLTSAVARPVADSNSRVTDSGRPGLRNLGLDTRGNNPD